MQQPPEDRLAALEASAMRHDQTIARLDTIIENHDELLERLMSNQEALKSNQEALKSNQEALKSNQEEIVHLLAEVARDAATTRRLWLRLAQRYGWLDDEQNGREPDTNPT